MRFPKIEKSTINLKKPTLTQVLGIGAIIVPLGLYLGIPLVNGIKLRTEAGRLSAPNSCIKDRAAYVGAELYTRAHYNIHYSCQTTVGAAIDDIVAAQKSRGYSMVYDGTAPSDTPGQPGMLGRFALQSDRYLLRYSMEPVHNYENDEAELLNQNPITSISVAVYLAADSPYEKPHD